MLLFIECIVACFVLLFVCVVGIANGPIGLVCLYEKDVQDRVVELGLTSREKIKRAAAISSVALLAPLIFLVPYMVYAINDASGFWEGFWQMAVILWVMGLFDRIFIDWYWVGHTKAWLIPGTEDLRPYIPAKTLTEKWIGTIVGYPVFAAIVAGVMTLL